MNIYKPQCLWQSWNKGYFTIGTQNKLLKYMYKIIIFNVANASCFLQDSQHLTSLHVLEAFFLIFFIFKFLDMHLWYSQD